MDTYPSNLVRRLYLHVHSKLTYTHGRTRSENNIEQTTSSKKKTSEATIAADIIMKTSKKRYLTHASCRRSQTRED